MPAFSFIHAADLHLDSPMLGLSEYEGAPAERLRGATRRAFEKLVDYAVKEGADFVLLAGDLYDGDWRDYNTGLFFLRCMARLREAGIRVYAVSGNHDAANVMTRRLSPPANMTRFGADAPETAVLDDLGVAVHGQSFASRAVTSNLALGYPAPAPGYVNIGLLHTAATGREGHEPYAPCAVDDLRSRGYDYWALGHIHARETLSDDPPIEFPGNTQGRHIRESGPKGCLHVRVDEDGAMQREFVPLDEVRWDVCRLAEDETGLPGVVDAFHEALPPLLESAGDRLLALRVVVESAPGRPAPDRDRLTNDLRAAALGAAPDRVWLEKVVRETARLQTPASESALAAVDAVFNDLLKADELPQALAKEVEALASSLPPGLRSRRGYNPADPAVWREAVEEARALLLETLSGGAEEET